MIERARQLAMRAGSTVPTGWVAPWIERSWQRCLGQGLQPHARAVFDIVSEQQEQRTREAHQQFVHTAKPIMEKLGHAIVDTRYFAILTSAEGIVVDTSGPIDRSDTRAHLLTRIGTDLSEMHVGTTAISTALYEQQPVWLHRGEHFFSNTTAYSCAGAPLRGPNGNCVGMLDLTGIDAVERPELKHLVTQTACKIENALVLAQAHALALRQNWPGNTLGTDVDGIVCLDADGLIVSANPAARQMVGGLDPATARAGVGVYAGDVFGVGLDLLFDAAKRGDHRLEIPLWNGLRLHAFPVLRTNNNSSWTGVDMPPHNRPLKEVETALIRKAVTDARGNVAQAALALGISRATVYRKLGKK